jgi:ABC-type uncharacterized transport system substrate-binding protein
MFLRAIIFVAALLVGAPVPAAGQQAGAIPAIGVLAQDLQPGLLDTFRDELQKLGYVEGKSITIVVRNAEGQNERLAALAAGLVERKVRAVVAVNTPAVQAAKRATATIPIVMMRVADPVKSGLVPSLARPGGNVTGLSFMPELLREIIPGVARMAALYQGNNAGATLIVDEVERKGVQLGLKFVRLPVHDPSDYAKSFVIASDAKAQALFVMDDGTITQHRRQILDLAVAHALPVVSIYRDFASAGGLIAYGPKLSVFYRRAAHYVDKLLKGEAASALPVEQPVSFDLAINLRTAKALGLTIPESVLIRADDIIE